MTWRTGKKVFRTIYRHEDGGPGNLIGVMDTPELARAVVDAVNEREALRAEAEDILERNRLMLNDMHDPNSFGAGACLGAMDAAQQILALLDEAVTAILPG